MKLIYLLLNNASGMMALSIAAGLASGFSSAGLIAVINYSLEQSYDSRLSLSPVFIGLCLLLLISSALSQMLVGRVVQRVILRLRLHLSQQILESPLKFIEELGRGRLMSSLVGDVNAIAVASYSVSRLFINLAILTGCGIYLNQLIPSFSFMGIVFLCLGCYSYHLLSQPGWKRLKLARRVSDKLFEHFGSLIQGIKELKIHRKRRRDFLQDSLKTSAKDFQDYHISANDWLAISGSWGLLLFFIPIGIFAFVPLSVGLSNATLSSYALTIIFMIAPLQGVLGGLPQLAQANISIKKIEELGISLDGATRAIPLGDIAMLPVGWRHLKLCGALHRYPSDQGDTQFSLGPLDLEFRAGEIVFIVGGNGSGKSTLVKMLTGLYTPEAGKIQLDDHHITDENRESYRQMFSVVFSDFHLFNSLLGLHSPYSDQQADYYLRQLWLSNKVSIENGKLSTTSLSQGQRKRLALLTAYLEDRPIYVFDEWASDQDPAFKRTFYHEILPALKQQGKTVFVISHDDAYFNVADRIIQFDYGQVIEDSAETNHEDSDNNLLATDK